MISRTVPTPMYMGLLPLVLGFSTGLVPHFAPSHS
jgi:hypothetical protein